MLPLQSASALSGMLKATICKVENTTGFPFGVKVASTIEGDPFVEINLVAG